jgi:hypothetical protein
MRYEINLTGSQIDLGRFGKHNLGPKSELQGAAMARLHLTGHGDRADALEGHGSIDVPHGRIYNLPLLLDILKFLREELSCETRLAQPTNEDVFRSRKSDTGLWIGQWRKTPNPADFNLCSGRQAANCKTNTKSNADACGNSFT